LNAAERHVPVSLNLNHVLVSQSHQAQPMAVDAFTMQSDFYVKLYLGTTTPASAKTSGTVRVGQLALDSNASASARVKMQNCIRNRYSTDHRDTSCTSSLILIAHIFLPIPGSQRDLPLYPHSRLYNVLHFSMLVTYMRLGAGRKQPHLNDEIDERSMKR
jgi:hypothetical protein